MIEIGIVGKPNVGKSTLFSALTLSDVPIANYPFTTIDANIGVGYVRVRCVCKELGVKDDPRNSVCIDGERFIPVKIIDTAGLVPDAWRGRGLGNRFLNKISMADALIHVIDLSGSTDIEGRPVAPGSHDPMQDIKFLENEIVMWFYRIIEENWKNIEKTILMKRERIEDAIYRVLSGVKIARENIFETLDKLDLYRKKVNIWTREDKLLFAKTLILSAKPIVIAGNKMDIPSADYNLDRIRDSGYDVIPISALAELILRKLTKNGVVKYLPGDSKFDILNRAEADEKAIKALSYIRKLFDKYGGTGVQHLLNHTVFNVLDMIVVYPVRDPVKLTDKDGNILPDAFLLKKGSTLKDLAYAIHTELGDKMLYGVDARNMQRIKSNYILKNNDVISIVSIKK